MRCVLVEGCLGNMPRRRNNGPVLTPEIGIRVTIQQALVATGFILMAGVAYGYLVWTQASQGADIKMIRDNFVTVSNSVRMATEEQDKKRDRLGEQFLASNKEIAEKVGALATSIAVQQSSLKSTDEKLTQLLTQFFNPPTQVPTPPRRP